MPGLRTSPPVLSGNHGCGEVDCLDKPGNDDGGELNGKLPV